MAGSILSGWFGHKKSGKMYSFFDPTGGHRAGDEVRVKPYNVAAKKDVITLFTVGSTHKIGTAGADGTQDYLDSKGINLKPILGGSLRTLPGFQSQQEKNPNFTLKQWKKDAQAQSELEQEYRLLPGMTESKFANIRGLIRGLRYD